MIYAPVSRAFKARMNAVTGPNVKAWWFNPRDGTAAVIGSYENKGEREFIPPEPGEMLDWGLVLDDEAKRNIASGIALDLEAMTQVVDWQQKEDVKRQMRRTIKECLRQSGADLASIEASTAKIMDVARARLAK